VTSTDRQDWELLEFLTQFALDREQGIERTCEQYQQLFPERADAVAQEYLRLTPAPAEHHGTIGGYQLLRELGRGGQGVVYAARDPRTNREVAIKVLTRHTGVSLERLRREASVAERIQHPGVAAVFDAGADGTQQWIAMALVAGTSLRDRLDAARATGRPPLDIAQHGATSSAAVPAVVGLVEDAARALDAAHRAGVIHRDIKPANIMVTPSGRPVLLDFGLARSATDDQVSLTRPGDMCGTPAYMAPEQWEPGPGARSTSIDLWGLAVVLYECLTLRRPFEGATERALAAAIRRTPHLPARAACPGLHRDLDRFLRVALDKDPRRRFRTAAAFADDLARIRRGEPLAAHPPGPLIRTARWCRRHPAPTAALALALALAATAAAWGAQRLRAQEVRSTELHDLARALLDDLQGAIRDVPGATHAREQIVNRALEFLRLADAGPRGANPSDLVRAHLAVGDVLGNPSQPSLGRTRDAEQHFRQALDLAAALDDAPASQLLRASAHVRLAALFDLAHRPADAARHATAALDLGAAGAEASGAGELLVRAHLLAADIAGHRSSLPDQERTVRDHLARARELLQEFSTAPRGRSGAAPGESVHAPWLPVHLCLAEARVELDVGAVEAAAARTARARDWLDGMPRVLRIGWAGRAAEAQTCLLEGQLAWRRGEFDAAEERLELAIDGLADLAAFDDAEVHALTDLIHTRAQLAQVLVDSEQLERATAQLQLGFEEVARHGAKRDAVWIHRAGLGLERVAGRAARAGLQVESAIEHARRALAHAQWLAGADPSDDRLRYGLADCRGHLASVLIWGGALDEAELELGRAATALAQLLETRPRPTYRDAMKSALQQLGEIAYARGDVDGAAARYRDAIGVHRDHGALSSGASDERSLAILLGGLARIEYARGQLAEGLDAVDEAIALCRAQRARSDEDRFNTRALAGHLVLAGRYARRGGDPKRAAALADEALALLPADPSALAPKEATVRFRAHVLRAILHQDATDTAAARAQVAAADAVLATGKVSHDAVFAAALAGLRAQLK